MKKVVMVLVFILIASFSLTMLSACTIVPKDYKELRNNLRSKDYMVQVANSGDEAIDLVLETLEIYVENMDSINSAEKADNLLENIWDDQEDLEDCIDTVVVALDYDDNEDYYEGFLVTIYFDDKEDVNAYYESFELFLDHIVDNEFANIDDEGGYLDFSTSSIVYGKENNVIYYGSGKILNDAK